MNKFGSDCVPSDLNNDLFSCELKLSYKPIYDIASRVLDIFLSLLFLILTSPIVFMTAVAIKFEDGGPVFYNQIRTGKDGIHFTIYKMRSMKISCCQTSDTVTKVGDARITTVGKFIRKTRIDEIPQLLLVLSGKMKFIGPRPLVPEQIEEFSLNLPEFKNRLVIKPGLTGLAQISGGNDLTPVEKLILDVEYINHRSFVLDFKIIWKTVGVVISGYGAR